PPEADPTFHREQLVEDDSLLLLIAEVAIEDGRIGALARRLVDDGLVEGADELRCRRRFAAELVRQLRIVVLAIRVRRVRIVDADAPKRVGDFGRAPIEL